MSASMATITCPCSGQSSSATSARCSCGKRPAFRCDCEYAATENVPSAGKCQCQGCGCSGTSGNACSCGEKSSGQCNCGGKSGCGCGGKCNCGAQSSGCNCVGGKPAAYCGALETDFTYRGKL
ncbi:hypothetical protein EV356DRAFT_501904 [Viridothelium virens]|uniref:Uncharacterized protein n=1 Tax=Viridothelium virens TaxID=1048519 RepID=A0A6A6H8I1_VIRVR|nr:hypothetical protein EV356DRAFT_501904 [Viridothelium virens]